MTAGLASKVSDQLGTIHTSRAGGKVCLLVDVHGAEGDVPAGGVGLLGKVTLCKFELGLSPRLHVFNAEGVGCRCVHDALSEGVDQGVGRGKDTALVQGLTLEGVNAITGGIQFSPQLHDIGVMHIVSFMQGEGGMDVSDGRLALSEGVAVEFIDSVAVDLCVVHGLLSGFKQRRGNGSRMNQSSTQMPTHPRLGALCSLE